MSISFLKEYLKKSCVDRLSVINANFNFYDFFFICLININCPVFALQIAILFLVLCANSNLTCITTHGSNLMWISERVGGYRLVSGASIISAMVRILRTALMCVLMRWCWQNLYVSLPTILV